MKIFPLKKIYIYENFTYILRTLSEPLDKFLKNKMLKFNSNRDT